MSDENKISIKTSAAKLFAANPVLVTGLILGPVVVCATSLQNAAALSIAFAMIVIPVLLFAAWVGVKLPGAVRTASYVAIAALMLIPSEMLISRISPIIFDSLGIYLPLMAVNSVVVAYSARYTEKHGVGTALMDGVFFSLGFAISSGILGLVRELLGSGTVWGVAVSGFKASAFLLPFSGFILLGFMAAAVQGIKSVTKKRGNKFVGEEEDL